MKTAEEEEKMPTVQVDSSLTLYYEDHTFADPWRKPEVVLLIHGVAESSRSWFGWVPHLAREFQVLRPDLRGFGRSTVPLQDFQWSPSALANDLVSTFQPERLDDLSGILGFVLADHVSADAGWHYS